MGWRRLLMQMEDGRVLLQDEGQLRRNAFCMSLDDVRLGRRPSNACTE